MDTAPAFQFPLGDLSPGDELILPHHRRAVIQFLQDEAGATALHIFHGDKEIVFDEPDLFGFGQALATQSRFVAGAAASWGCDWARAKQLLSDLLDQGVLMRAGPALALAPAPAPLEAARPSPLPPSACRTARDWNECEAITRDMTGRAVELGYLELIVPIFRVAHVALDGDGRQVGEANVFPPALRLDVPTQWRSCNLPGTRHQSDRPMNVTAMRAMRTHWVQMMACVLRVRGAFLERFPDAAGAWTVGRVERLATCVLSLPTYQLMRRSDPVANGALHPALSSLFRVTDGVRMVMHQMLFVPIGEPAWSPDQTVSVDAILDYAERNYSFFSDHGVCAGPLAMVRELLCVLLHGRGDRDYAAHELAPDVARACDDVQPAIEYGLLGLQAYAAVFSLWPTMTRAYEQISALLEDHPGADRDRMAAHRETLLRGTYLGHESWRASREDVYADMYDQCARGLGEPDASLIALLAHGSTRSAHTGLEAIFRRRLHLHGAAGDRLARDLAAVVLGFLQRAQSILRAADTVQRRINRLLGRDPPLQALSAATIDVHNLMQGSKRLPFLIDELEQWLTIRITLDTDRLAIEDAA